MLLSPSRVKKRKPESPLSELRRTRHGRASSSGRSTSPEKAVESSWPRNSNLLVPKPRPVQLKGLQAWEKDIRVCETKWKKGELEGYGGLIATIMHFHLSDMGEAASCQLLFEDMDGRPFNISLEMAFNDLTHYPDQYTFLCFSEDELPRRASKIFARFSNIYELDVSQAVTALVSALQGNDDIDGGARRHQTAPAGVADGEDWCLDWNEVDWDENVGGHITGIPAHLGMNGSQAGLGIDWALLKTHFQQAVEYGYRPGLTQVSDHYVVSFSIPFKNIDIDPNILGMWDDGLVKAWEDNHRFILFFSITAYPPDLDKVKFTVGQGSRYKPSPESIKDATRHSIASKPPGGSRDFEHFYLSATLDNYLKSFGRCYRTRTSFQVNWTDADAVGMDETMSKKVFCDGMPPEPSRTFDPKDPVVKGHSLNIPLVAFWWALRRFVEAPKYCLNCGLEVAIPSVRPYVCDKPLCLYGFMSLGLGPSVVHVIKTQPGVVDLLVSLAFAAASAKTRMEMPLGLHIELPDGTLLDQASDKARSLADLIRTIPKISTIKAHLEQGGKLHQIETSSGAITVLRWIVGSCRAYLKETKEDEGVLNEPKPHLDGNLAGSCLRQFLFVVGSPEQENNFRQEIAAAQVAKPRALKTRLSKYPTLMAFHGSSLERWHNILRTGLDYSETICGRVYGHGVYFSPESSVSICSYSQPSRWTRAEADFPVERATALVELVNVPETFVSRKPYYVVDKVKQMKPFLLLVHGSGEQASKIKRQGRRMYERDPSNPLITTFDRRPLEVTMPVQLQRTVLCDNEPYDETDAEMLKVPTPSFVPSLEERFLRLHIMPPPTETSVVASKALQKEFKNLVNLQQEDKLPFYIDPDTESLYCWVMELFDFPESKLKEDMKRLDVKSIITEVQFPASFPHAPPFMRILHPRCLPFMSGGGGNITAGGSVCNEILTSSGWNPAFCIEAMVRDIMTNMTEATRLDPHRWNEPYNLHEAVDAFKRVAAQHGWAVPKDFDKMAQ